MKIKGHRNLLEVMDMLITLTVVMISQVYAYVQTHQNVYIKCNFLYIKYTRIKLEAGEGVWGRMDTCICMAESLCCLPETITTLLISYTPI